MKLFYCNSFEGHNPVGTSAVVVARNKSEARDMLMISLAEEEGLEQVISVLSKKDAKTFYNLKG